jgi:cyanate lyase
MRREQLKEQIPDIKRKNGWSWKHITEHIGGLSPVVVVGALFAQTKLPRALALKAARFFGLSATEERLLNETDPLLYRLYELVMVNGPTHKALIEEDFGDGIVSAKSGPAPIPREIQVPDLSSPFSPRFPGTLRLLPITTRCHGLPWA